MSRSLTVKVDGFDLEKFNEENPVFDPFVERLNNREVMERGYCWGCVSEFDIATGKVIREADPECDEILSHRQLCKHCRKFLKEDGLNLP